MKRLALIALLALGACGGENDAPKHDVEDLGEWELIRAPSGWGDVVTICVGPLRLFVGNDDSYASSAVTAVIDPTCTG